MAVEKDKPLILTRDSSVVVENNKNSQKCIGVVDIGTTAVLHEKLSILAGEVIWAVRNETALNVEDFLARRRRPLFQDTRSAVEAAPRTAAMMAKELNKDRPGNNSK